MKRLKWKPYIDQKDRWPDRGRVIMAQYDDQSIVVYQAYGYKIGKAAASAGHLVVPGFSFDRMSWIKTNFLWMMHRSAWATSDGQQVVLAIWIQRAAFDSILSQAVHTKFEPDVYPSPEDWKSALDHNPVRVQWDPDHPPHGPKLKRRAIQLGLGGDVLRHYATQAIIHIEDITELVHQQAEFREMPDFMLTPAERIYPVADHSVAQHLMLDKWAAK